jgi:hypothetical protein
MSAKKITFLAIGASAWLVSLGASFAALQRYAATAGSAQAPALHAAELLAAHRTPGRGLVIMATHPLCPCTEASFAELGDLLARSRTACDAVILEYQPLRPPADWSQGATSRELGGQRVPVIRDRGGRLAAALGAETSGHVVLIDARGTMRFHGGLTLARGHRGRSPAQDAILAVLNGGKPALDASPVYGCALTSGCKTECSPEAAP